MSYDALYARQSIEKVDSISIESQLEYCKYEAHGNPYKAYIDRGYSGKNTNRPAFEELLADIQQGQVARVIVYKLDRISRSILDFANMMEVFQTHGVEFVSSTERFDTATPIGRAMLNICIVFAQLERETIQKRVADAYYSRCKRGLYMGGRLPYGFTKTDTVVDGIKTSMYVPVPEEAEQIRLLYALYANPAYSLGDVIQYFNENGIQQRRGGDWSTARLSELLRNPIYVKADVDVYEFFIRQGARVINPVADFTGEHACYLYQGTEAATRKQGELKGKEVVLAPHQGIVPAHEWLRCRERCICNRRSTRTCKPKNSWLAGKVKCGRCGYGLTIVKANTRWQRYFVCAAALATKKQACKGTGITVYAEVLEDYVFRAIKKRLAEFQTLTEQRERPPDAWGNQRRARLIALQREIEELLTKVVNANSTLMTYLNQRVETLEAERLRLQEEVLADSRRSSSGADKIVLTNHTEEWENTTFEEKQAVVDALIEVITIADGSIEIAWNI